MKYPINLKDASALYRKAEAAKSYANWMRSNRDWHTEMDQSNANAAYDAAQTAYEAEADRVLSAALDEAQGRAKVRTIKTTDIISALAEIEDTLSIRKKAMDGIRVEVDLNAQDFPNAYKYRPESTIFSALYKNGAWRVTDIGRYPTHRASCRISVIHTDASKNALIERFSSWS